MREKNYLKINELIPYKIYDIKNNEYPNLYFILLMMKEIYVLKM